VICNLLYDLYGKINLKEILGGFVIQKHCPTFCWDGGGTLIESTVRLHVYAVHLLNNARAYISYCLKSGTKSETADRRLGSQPRSLECTVLCKYRLPNQNLVSAIRKHNLRVGIWRRGVGTGACTDDPMTRIFCISICVDFGKPI
jgi:hypothetical protein